MTVKGHNDFYRKVIEVFIVFFCTLCCGHNCYDHSVKTVMTVTLVVSRYKDAVIKIITERS